MQLLKLLTDDDAVSPVIAVILMVAITVILGAVIATFTLGLGNKVDNSAPQADFSFEYSTDTGEVTVTHASGDDLDNGQLKMAGAAVEYTSFGSINWNNDDTSAIDSGDSVDVAAKRGEELRVVWKSESGEDTATLSDYSVPRAEGTFAAIADIDASDAAGISTDGNLNNGQEKNGHLVVTGVAENVGGSVFIVLDDDGPFSGSGDMSEKTDTVSVDDSFVKKNFTIDRTAVSDDETMTVKIYETSSRNNLLDEGTAKADPSLAS